MALAGSSGRNKRHRCNPSGNQRLNRSLYTMAITQIRANTEGQAYYQRKRDAGKSKKGALRSLKRRLSDIVYTTMHVTRSGWTWASATRRMMGGQEMRQAVKEMPHLDLGKMSPFRVTFYTTGISRTEGCPPSGDV